MQIDDGNALEALKSHPNVKSKVHRTSAPDTPNGQITMAKKLAVGYCSEFGALSGAHGTGLVSFSSESPHLHARWNPSPVCQSGAHRTVPVSVKVQSPNLHAVWKKRDTAAARCNIGHIR